MKSTIIIAAYSFVTLCLFGSMWLAWNNRAAPDLYKTIPILFTSILSCMFAVYPYMINKVTKTRYSIAFYAKMDGMPYFAEPHSIYWETYRTMHSGIYLAMDAIVPSTNNSTYNFYCDREIHMLEKGIIKELMSNFQFDWLGMKRTLPQKEGEHTVRDNAPDSMNLDTKTVVYFDQITSLYKDNPFIRNPNIIRGEITGDPIPPDVLKYMNCIVLPPKATFAITNNSITIENNMARLTIDYSVGYPAVSGGRMQEPVIGINVTTNGILKTVSESKHNIDIVFEEKLGKTNHPEMDKYRRWHEIILNIFKEYDIDVLKTRIFKESQTKAIHKSLQMPVFEWKDRLP